VKIKTTLNFHLSPVRMAVIKHINNHTCWWGWSKVGTLYTVSRNVYLYNHIGKLYRDSLKIKI
jgi:hypothetical protein